MEVGLVQKINIDEEMQQAYLDYAMSVIVARALPDARDGLKPVHRRILYAMYDMGLRPDTAYKKSARIVGEVLGKYHPHGDMAVYEAMARMAQDFSMRYTLVDGQGNFGSVDGDPPAAMRYTEARLATPAFNILTDIHKNTVDFDDNFDGTLQEPTVLPAALPNLLVNGATGIAVGMSTSIPPHNLCEVVDAIKYMLESWEKLDDIDVEDLMRFVQGPDFPTGGIIIQEAEGDGLMSAYGSGRGRVVVQARAHLEEMERGRNRIIVTELPYMTNKASLIERIAELVREERVEGIVDLRDESDRQGMRIVIELNKNADPEAVLRDLYKHTPMRSTFSLIMLALVEGEPRLLSLKQALRVYVEHRLEIVRRRSEYDLERAKQRAHILEGLRVALKNLDEIIEMIRKSPDVETARTRLMKRFKLSEIQAQAILDMPLRRLAALERKKIEEEYKEVQVLIKELESLLRSPKKMRQVVGDELQVVKEAYGDVRRTQIVHLKEGQKRVTLLTAGDLTPEKTIWLAVTPQGLISRTAGEKQPQLSGQDAPAWIIRASSRDTLYLVCERGEAAAIPVHTLPEVEKPSEGAPLSRVSALRESNRLAAMFTLPAKADRPEDHYILSATRQGMVKKSPLSELPGPAAGIFTLAKVNEGDRLGWLRVTDGQAEVLLVTAQGMAIRFSEEEVRPMGLVAAGVMGIKLQAGDEVTGADLYPQAGQVFLLASDGSAKRVPADQFTKQGRYGQGIQAWKLHDKVQVVGAAAGKSSTRAIIHLESSTPIFIRFDQAPLVNRAARGHMIKELKSAGLITGLTVAQGLNGTSAESEEEEKPKSSRSRTKAAAEEVGGQVKGSGMTAKSVKGQAKSTGTDGSKAKSASAQTKKPARVKPDEAESAPAKSRSKAAPRSGGTRAKTAASPAKSKQSRSKAAAATNTAPAKPATARSKKAAVQSAPEPVNAPAKSTRGRTKAAPAQDSAPGKAAVDPIGTTRGSRSRAKAPAEAESPQAKTAPTKTSKGQAKTTPAKSSSAPKAAGSQAKAAEETAAPTRSKSKKAKGT